VAKNMKCNKLGRCIGLLIGIAISLVVLLALPETAQSWMLKLSLQTLSEGADSIIVGTVVEQNSYWNAAHSNIYTAVAIAAEERLKGVDVQERFTVIVPGGKVGDSAQWVEDAAELKQGERLVIFLRQLDSKDLPGMLAEGQQPAMPQYKVFGDYQGKFAINDGQVGNLTLGQFKSQVNSILTGQPLTGNMTMERTESLSAPSISWVNPTSAPAGTGSPNSRVVITGSNFGATQGTGKVYFVRNGYAEPGTEATILSWSDTSITALVPAGVDGNYLYVSTTAGHSNKFTFDVTFSYDGYKWPGTNPVINYKVNENCPSTTGEAAAIQAAAATWNAATGTNFTLNYAGPTDQITPGYPECRIWWQNSGANLIPALSSVSTSGGFITEAHIIFNSYYNWSTNTPPSNYDIESIALHEFGHWLSLHDQNGTADVAKVMYGTLGYDQKRILQSTDRAGIVWIYGSTNAAKPDKIATYLNGTWYLDYNGNGVWNGVAGGDRQYTFGNSSMTPVSGNWNGTGGTEIGAFLNGTWYLDYNGNGVWNGVAGGDRQYTFGNASMKPVSGDWNSDNKTEIGTYLNGTWYIDYNGNGVWNGTGGGDKLYTFGNSSMRPVTGNWNDDGKTEIGAFYNGTWYLDYNGNGVWNGTGGGDRQYTFGNASMIPVSGNWNGTGGTEIGAFYNGTWYLDYNGNGVWNGVAGGDKQYTFGNGTMKPVSGAW